MGNIVFSCKVGWGVGCKDGVSWEAVVGCSIRNELCLLSHEDTELDIDSTLDITFEVGGGCGMGG